MEYEIPRIYVCQNPSILLQRIPSAQLGVSRLELELSLRKQVSAARLVPGMGIPDSHFRSHHAYFRGRCLTRQHSSSRHTQSRSREQGSAPGPFVVHTLSDCRYDISHLSYVVELIFYTGVMCILFAVLYYVSFT